MTNCATSSFFLMTRGSFANTVRCFSLWGKLAAALSIQGKPRRHSDRIIFILKTSKITQPPPCSQVEHVDASPTAGQSARPFVGEICSVLSSGRRRRRQPSLVLIMSRAEPEEETLLRSRHIKPSDYHYCLFNPTFTPPPPPPYLSSSSRAGV